ncbi:hypothetical protein HDF22_001534 [Mucilaginibacter lappiensis]|uniref:Uncharacterized protein n=1 Tax=Mucilaginibacter lappiensis TaxID=354630 RepID=A0A841JCV9_9SPHI|nr:hypothetical protein [Mucilaginibacter lappiensis]
MNPKEYLEIKIKELEDQLTFVRECREREICKEIPKRNYNILLMLHKDEKLYLFCLNELKLFLERFYE